jgi:hypothetical protein
MLVIGTQIRYRITAILAAHWEEFFLTYRGWIRPVVIETVRQVRACRTPALGCHLYQCPECGRYAVVAHSCKSRFCPTCGKHATDRWADGVLNDLLEVPYHHLVFSPPGQLRPIILLNREVGLGLLARAAAACLNQWAREQHGMRMGFVSVLHTFGADLKWHPHVHMLVTEGGLSLDGERWVEPYNTGWLMAHAGVKKMWRYHVVKALRKAHRNQELRFPAGAAFLREFPYFNALLRKLYEFTWYAHIGACLLDPTASLRYIGRYTKRAVLAEYGITYYDGHKVRFAFRDYANGGRTSFKTLPVLAFLGRLLRHVPDKNFKMVRHGGLFAPRWKERYLPQARRALGQPEPAPAAASTDPPASLRTWEERQLAQGREPLWCAPCAAPMLLLDIVFGPHPRIEKHFRLAGRAVQPVAAHAAMPP